MIAIVVALVVVANIVIVAAIVLAAWLPASPLVDDIADSLFRLGGGLLFLGVIALALSPLSLLFP